MEELRLSVIDAADALCREYMSREVERCQYPPYKANGMAYIRFAMDEKELFKLLYMRYRSAEDLPPETDLNLQMTSIVHSNTGLDRDNALLFHLEMWSFVHGIATMTATGFCRLDWELISQMLTDAYQGLKKHYETK